MARSRQIKPTFFMHEIVSTLSAFTRLYWIGLWTLADRDGRLDYRPMRIKAQLFPYEEVDIHASTSELEAKGFVQRYKIQDGRIVLQITNWSKHQKPHQNETLSELPPMEQALGESSEVLSLVSCTPVPCTLNLDCGAEAPPVAEQAPLVLMGEPKRKSRQSKKGPKLTDLKPESVKPFEAAWETMPPTAMQRVQTFPGKWMDQEIPVQRGSRAQAERNFQSIVDAGHATPRELYAAFYVYTQGPRNGFYQHLSTFYGPEKATWREYLTQAREAIAAQDAQKA